MTKILAFPNKLSAEQPVAVVLTHREQLLAYCEQVFFPAEQYYDQEFGLVTLDRAGHDLLRHMFTMFGVTGLDPSGEDFDAVVSTWDMLNSVGTDLRARHLFPDTVYAYDSLGWHPTYLQYINALWDGDHPTVLSAARDLGIHQGVPEDAEHPRKGPLPSR